MAILLLGFFIRIYHISTNPPELFHDEIACVLSVRSILTTGKDIDGKLGIFLYNRVEQFSPICGYLSAFSTFILGNNIFSIRLTAVLLGVASIYLFYLFCSKLFDKKTALISAFLFSILPWTIHFSRIAWEQPTFLPFLLLSLLTFFSFIKSKKPFAIISIYLSFGVFLYTYKASEFVSPLFLFFLIFLYWNEIGKNLKIHIIGIVIFFIFLIPVVHYHFDNRIPYNRTASIFTFSEGINRKTLQIFVNNYFSHFSFNFLFKSGDPNLRHGPANHGVLYLFFLPFLVVGLIEIIRLKTKRVTIFLLFWLLCFPLGGALTNDGVPHAPRTILGAPILVLLTSIGLQKVFTVIKNNIFRYAVYVSFVIIALFNLVTFLKYYYYQYPIASQLWWGYGQKEIFTFIKSTENNYQIMCLENLNYWNEESLIKYYLPQNKIIIVSDLNNLNCFQKKSLLVANTTTFVDENIFEKIYVVNDLNGKPLWNIYRNRDSNQL